eukprot:GILJ01002484.1.p1 GENE.GILJ01002484.1~~GILJ01002484.1.p1  ORF type:complete len:578 (+),score=93.01 GILJ01002484.1:237-1736(+)
MTGMPGVCLCVPGPGLVHCLSGLANAWANAWPMVVLAGGNDLAQDATGGFQECAQLDMVRPFVKWAARPESIARIPFYIEKALRTAVNGRPGAVYLEFPGDILAGRVEESAVQWVHKSHPVPRCLADPRAVVNALDLLKTAKNPLVILGKGAAYDRAEEAVHQFLETTKLPFLPTPMAKGLVSDEHPLCVSAARSLALQNADVILLVGARLNWILHFGKAPRFNPDVKIIQIDISAEEMGNNVQSTVPLVGHCRDVIGQFNQVLANNRWTFAPSAPWWMALRKKLDANKLASDKLFADSTIPLNYYRALKEVQDNIPKDCIIIGEGANTMDIGRTVLLNHLPRHRLDAGTFGTMGVGIGFAFAAQAVHPDKKVVAVVGDSAFGFSGMELETAARFGFPLVVVIINNNGIYAGVEELPADRNALEMLPTALTPEAHYEKIAEAFGGLGFFCRTPEEINAALKTALAAKVPSVINVMISPYGSKKPQEHAWLTREAPKAKL